MSFRPKNVWSADGHWIDFEEHLAVIRVVQNEVTYLHLETGNLIKRSYTRYENICNSLVLISG